MEKQGMVKLNIPVTIEQLEAISKVVAKVTATRESRPDNERITKSSVIRALIEAFPFDQLDCSQLYNEASLKERISGFITGERSVQELQRSHEEGTSEKKPSRILLP